VGFHAVLTVRVGFAIRNRDGEKNENQSTCDHAASGVVLRVAPDISPDPDLARLIEVWPHLPEAIRRAVAALSQHDGQAQATTNRDRGMRM
jgi:hypothetical protein